MIHVVKRTPEDVAALRSMNVDRDQVADDGTVYDGVTVTKPWGHESQVFHRRGGFSVWRLSITSRSETSFHCHPGKDTVLVVSAGHIIVHTFGGRVPMIEGDVCIIEAGAFHKTLAVVSSTVVEMESSGNRRDLVRFADRYGRAGKAYEAV